DGGFQLAVAEYFHLALCADHSGFAKNIGVDSALAERRNLFQVHDVIFLTENVGEAALRQAAMQRHLAAFKSTHHARTTARTLALMAAGRSLAHARAHAASDALPVFGGFSRLANS